MKQFQYILLFICLIGSSTQAQSLNNFGNLYLHPGANLGIHANYGNFADFTALDNTLLGFYGIAPNNVRGSVPISVFDVEFGNEAGTFLEQQIQISNNANFISGNVITPQSQANTLLQFGPAAFHTGASDNSKVVGYVAMDGQAEFTFPTGNGRLLRPLTLNTTVSSQVSTCAYIPEDPDAPIIMDAAFNVNAKSNEVGQVSRSEFWVLNHTESATITLNWLPQSNLADLTEDVEEIILVGWSKTTNQWIPISGANGIGTLEEGMITSDAFLPERFGAITFASGALPRDTFITKNPSLENHLISPNGDGKNDFLVLDILAEEQPNYIYIFNKFGQKVFEMANYYNQFGGVSNINNGVLDRDIGLPEGIYYYIVDLPERELQYQGFFFLDR